MPLSLQLCEKWDVLVGAHKAGHPSTVLLTSWGDFWSQALAEGYSSTSGTIPALLPAHAIKFLRSALEFEARKAQFGNQSKGLWFVKPCHSRPWPLDPLEALGIFGGSCWNSKFIEPARKLAKLGCPWAEAYDLLCAARQRRRGDSEPSVGRFNLGDWTPADARHALEAFQDSKKSNMTAEDDQITAAAARDAEDMPSVHRAVCGSSVLPKPAAIRDSIEEAQDVVDHAIKPYAFVTPDRSRRAQSASLSHTAHSRSIEVGRGVAKPQMRGDLDERRISPSMWHSDSESLAKSHQLTKRKRPTDRMHRLSKRARRETKCSGEPVLYLSRSPGIEDEELQSPPMSGDYLNGRLPNTDDEDSRLHDSGISCDASEVPEVGKRDHVLPAADKLDAPENSKPDPRKYTGVRVPAAPSSNTQHIDSQHVYHLKQPALQQLPCSQLHSRQTHPQLDAPHEFFHPDHVHSRELEQEHCAEQADSPNAHDSRQVQSQDTLRHHACLQPALSKSASPRPTLSGQPDDQQHLPQQQAHTHLAQAQQEAVAHAAARSNEQQADVPQCAVALTAKTRRSTTQQAEIRNAGSSASWADMHQANIDPVEREAFNSLKPGKWLTTTAITTALESLNPNPDKFHVSGPTIDIPSNPNQSTTQHRRLVSCDFTAARIAVNHDNKHWTLGCVDIDPEGRRLLQGHDPMPSQMYRQETMASLTSIVHSNVMTTQQMARDMTWPVQSNSYDCGVLVALIALLTLHDLPVRPLDTRVCRRAFGALLKSRKLHDELLFAPNDLCNDTPYAAASDAPNTLQAVLANIYTEASTARRLLESTEVLLRMVHVTAAKDAEYLAAEDEISETIAWLERVSQALSEAPISSLQDSADMFHRTAQQAENELERLKGKRNKRSLACRRNRRERLASARLLLEGDCTVYGHMILTLKDRGGVIHQLLQKQLEEQSIKAQETLYRIQEA